jgi:PAS domain S-box-containing protein
MLSTDASLRRYGVAVLVSFLALLLRSLLEPLLGERAPLLVFVIPVMLSAWYGGLVPGLVATGLSGFLGTYFFVLPRGSLGVMETGDGVRVGIFFLEGFLISWLNDALRQSRRRAEVTALSLRDSEERYRQLVEDVKDYAIFMLDPEGRIASWNAGAERIKGYQAGEVLGKPFSLLFTPEGVAEHQPEQELQTAQAHGKFEGEGWRQRKDGTQFWADVVVTALRDSSGRLRGFSKITRDITERKQAETALRRSAQRLQALHEIDRAILEAQSSQELTYQALVQMRCLLPYQQAFVLVVNSAEQAVEIIASAGETPGSGTRQRLPLETLALEDGRQSCPPELASFISEPAASCVKLSLQVRNSTLGALVLFLSPRTSFTSESQAIAQEVAAQLAVALYQARLREELQRNAIQLEQRVAERTAELQSANEALEAFAYSISHDLRAPLRAMEGLGQALLEDYQDQIAPEGQDYLRRIVAAAAQMEGLIQDLLHYSRLSRMELPLTSVDLQSVITVAWNRLHAEVAAQRAQLTIAQPLPSVLGHWGTLVQVIANLLMNALKFTAAGVSPRIHIWAEVKVLEAPARVRLWVEDQGIGIDPQFQERIFQVFERLHGVEIYPGTGIGLAIVRKGVERMGGQVGVVSEVGQGSRFWMELVQASEQESL